jgi:glycogen debranching enzyme
MNEELGARDDTSDLLLECESLTRLVNLELWDEKSGFYYDKWKNGELNYVKHVSAFWALLAEVCDKEKLSRLISHLENENEFNTVTPIPSLSKDHPDYRPDGGYALGSSIASTSYMTLMGLMENGYDSLCYELSRKYLDTVVTVFNETGTIFENYAPDIKRQGNPAKADFVGWSGLIPISVFLECFLGIRADVPDGKIIFNVNRLERHGVKNYPFGNDNICEIISEERLTEKDEPKITFRAKHPVTLTVIHNGKETVYESKPL